MSKRQFLITLLGCWVPLTGLATILLLNIRVNAVLLIVLLLLCPLSHLLKMVQRLNEGKEPQVAPVFVKTNDRN